MQFTTNYENAILMRKSILTTRSWSVVVWQQINFSSARFKFGLSGIQPTGAENTSYLQNVKEQEKMQSFQDFLRQYKTKDVVPTLEAGQKKVEFYHNKALLCSNLSAF